MLTQTLTHRLAALTPKRACGMFVYFHTPRHTMHYCGWDKSNEIESDTANLVLSCRAPSRQTLGDAVSWSYVDNKDVLGWERSS